MSRVQRSPTNRRRRHRKRGGGLASPKHSGAPGTAAESPLSQAGDGSPQQPDPLANTSTSKVEERLDETYGVPVVQMA